MIGPDADYCKTTGDLNCHCLQAQAEIARLGIEEGKNLSRMKALEAAVRFALGCIDGTERDYVGRLEPMLKGALDERSTNEIIEDLDRRVEPIEEAKRRLDLAVTDLEAALVIETDRRKRSILAEDVTS